MTSDLDQYLGRKYKLTDGDLKNFDEYMKFIDVGLILRKTAASVNPVGELIKDADGNYTLTFTTAIKNLKSVFRLGEEKEEERADGVKVISVQTWEDGKLIQVETEKNGRKSKHERTFTMDTLTAVTTAEGWDGKVVRVYTYQP